MKRIAEAAWLEARIYLKTGKVILPALALLTYLMAFYSIGPVDIVSSSALNALALSLVSVWAGISFSRSEEAVVSQLVQLKLHSPAREAACQALILLAGAAIATVLSAAWPLLKNIASGGKFYTREISAADIVGMVSLFFSASMMGGAYGSLLHPRIFRDSRAAWLIALAGCLLGTFSGAIIRNIPAFAYITPLFPPIYGLITQFDETLSLGAATLTQSLALCWAYAAAAFALKTILLRRIRY
jgi:hypothetical protein